MTVHSDTLTREKPRDKQPLLALDGQAFKNMLRAGERWLAARVDVVNSLNVFPVPDGDTGTNMLLTMHSTLQEIGHSPDQHLGRIAAAAAQGALMGARGNSGVILSQILRGLARGLEAQEQCTVVEYARALQEASDAAYRSVVKPVEGTILTVIRETAATALQASTKTDDFVEFLATALKAAQDAEAITPNLLPLLNEAGVVDAGGQGLVYILEGGWRFLNGDTQAVADIAPVTLERQPPLAIRNDGYGYDVQFLIHGQGLDVAAIRARIDAMGESTLVVGDQHLVKVHVHVPDPGTPISYGVSQGLISDVVVENMDDQHRQFVRNKTTRLGELGPKPRAPTEELTKVAIVGVVNGLGLTRIFESLGVSAIVSGGQTMNPSTQEFLEVIDRLAADNVLILPNNSNIILAAQQAAQLSQKRVRVVPTKTIPQGISALLAFNFQTEVTANAERMLAAAQDVQTIALTRAIRTTRLNGVDVKEGDVIGLLNDTLLSAGPDFEAVVMDVLQQMETDDYEITTIYFGKDASPNEVNMLATRISQQYPGLEIEVLDGGQAHYRYILSLE